MDEFRLALSVRSQLAVRLQQAVSLADKRGVFAGGTRRHSFWLLADRGTPIQPVRDVQTRLPVLYRPSSDRLYSCLMRELADGGRRCLLVAADRKEMQILGSPDPSAFDIVIMRSSYKLEELLESFQPEKYYIAQAA
jgi:hypothetical protein